MAVFNKGKKNIEQENNQNNKIFKDKEDFKEKYLNIFKKELGASFEESNSVDRYNMLATLIQKQSNEIGNDCKNGYRNKTQKSYKDVTRCCQDHIKWLTTSETYRF